MGELISVFARLGGLTMKSFGDENEAIQWLEVDPKETSAH